MTDLFVQNHWPVGVKSIFTWTDTQYVPAVSTTLDGRSIVNVSDSVFVYDAFRNEPPATAAAGSVDALL
jgi:hypothetical protein